jgi:hypothetical protein
LKDFEVDGEANLVPNIRSRQTCKKDKLKPGDRGGEDRPNDRTKLRGRL